MTINTAALPKTFCPVCQNSGQPFMPIDPHFRVNAERYGFDYYGCGEMTKLDSYSCSICGASDRERLYAWWVCQQLREGKLLPSSRILHFAPEASLSGFMRNIRIFQDYKTADLMMSNVDYTLDLMDIALPDGCIDFFICSHVLEHVADDRKAVKELFRITAKGGFGLIMAPIVVGLEQTREDPTVTTKAERWRLFGQDDHVRLYAKKDYVACIASGGFAVKELSWRHFGAKMYKILGLKPSSTLYVAEKL